jgi:cell division protein FtsB
LRAWVRVAQDLRIAKENLAATSAERAALEHKVAHMRPDQLEPDLLDSQVRKTLDVVAPDEIVIMRPGDKR